MRPLFLATLVATLLVPASAGASTHSRHHHELRVIRPYIGWLRSTGDCESGTRSLHSGLRAVGGGGAYRGRYQMTFQIWAAVGGRGDPAAADWLEQAYRAVLVLRRYGHGQWPVCG